MTDAEIETTTDLAERALYHAVFVWGQATADACLNAVEVLFGPEVARRVRERAARQGSSLEYAPQTHPESEVWIAWHGQGDRPPVPPGCDVDVRFRNGVETMNKPVGCWKWDWDVGGCYYYDIVAYRVCQKEEKN